MLSAGASLAKTGRSSQSTRWCESLAVPTAAPTGMPGPPQLQHRALGSPLGGVCAWRAASPAGGGLQRVAEQVSVYPRPRSAHVCLAEHPMAAGTRLGHPTLSLGWGACAWALLPAPRAVGPRHLGPGPAALLLHMFQLLSEAASAPGQCCNRRARLCRLLAVALV